MFWSGRAEAHAMPATPSLRSRPRPSSTERIAWSSSSRRTRQSSPPAPVLLDSPSIREITQPATRPRLSGFSVNSGAPTISAMIGAAVVGFFSSTSATVRFLASSGSAVSRSVANHATHFATLESRRSRLATRPSSGESRARLRFDGADGADEADEEAFFGGRPRRGVPLPRPCTCTFAPARYMQVIRPPILSSYNPFKNERKPRARVKKVQCAVIYSPGGV